MSDQPGQPSEEELRAALEEQLRQLRVEDVLLQTIVTLVNLAGRRLTAEGEKDPEQAKLAIEAVRALLPLSPQEELAPIRDALAQLQMLYVREAQQGGEAPGAAPEQPSAEELEREKARSEDLDASGHLVGIFGGSGFYRFLDDVEEVAVDTPYGPPSARIRIGGSTASASPSCPATATSTSCRRTASTTAPTSGRCARSGCGESSGRRPAAR